MAHSLPQLGSPQRELFDVADLAAIGTGQRPVPTVEQARRSARALFADSAVVRVASIAWDASLDQLLLVTIGPRGGVRREWCFGGATRQMVLA
jgi:hypothetical protein